MTPGPTVIHIYYPGDGSTQKNYPPKNEKPPIYIYKDLYDLSESKSGINICVIIRIFAKEMISKLRDILVKLSKVLPSPEKAHSFANPPQTLLSDAFTGTRLHKACPE